MRHIRKIGVIFLAIGLLAIFVWIGKQLQVESTATVAEIPTSIMTTESVEATTEVTTISTTETETTTETTSMTTVTTMVETTAATSESTEIAAETTTAVTTTETIPTLQASGIQVITISVSCLKVTWNAEENRDYTVTCTVLSDDIGYVENMDFIFPSNSVCYVTGLREDAAYSIAVVPERKEGEQANVVPIFAYGKTETVEVIEEFEPEDGWTNCFTYEAASGLTQNPSYSAIAGAKEDVITATGIMRNDYGDYCAAMGTFYGYCGDRFLVTLENGIQFTVQICDSKGDRWYHDYDTSGKSVIEFIVADDSVPSEVQFTGNYGYYNWSGLNLTANIQSIQKINYGNPVTY